MNKFLITAGLRADHIPQAARLFWAAFAEKLRVPLGPQSRAHGFLCDVIDPGFAISALAPDGQLLGVAGIKTPGGAFVGGRFADLRRHYGLWRAVTRLPLLSVLERDCADGVLLMDGIFVSADARGCGIGTALLGAVIKRARQENCHTIRLDVIDTNPRARALYERVGFHAVETAHLGPLRHIFGFRSATTMQLRVET